MITFSGIRIEPRSAFGGRYLGVPGISDIALGLGRIPRFVGQTRRWWPNILHALVCERIAQMLGLNERVRFLALMHDAHECVTSDIPGSSWKSADTREEQKFIDSRMYQEWRVWPLRDEEIAQVEVIDAFALSAEAQVLGPPAIMLHVAPSDNEVIEHIVRRVAMEYPSPIDTDGIDSPATRAFIEKFARLLPCAVSQRPV